MSFDYNVGGCALSDFKDDEKAAQEDNLNFKEQILRDLEQASRKRKLQEESERQRKAIEGESERLKQEELQIGRSEEQFDQQTSEHSLSLEANESNKWKRYQQVGYELDDSLNHRELQSYLSSQNQESFSTSISERTSLGIDFEKDKKNNEVSEVVASSEAVSSESLNSQNIQQSQHSILDDKSQLEFQNEAIVTQVEAQNRLSNTSKKEATRRKKNNKIAAKIATLLVVFLLFIFCLTTILGYRYLNSSLGAIDSQSKKYVTVEIPQGSGNKLIGQILQQKGLIRNASIFNYYARFKNVSDLHSGYYNLRKNMTVKDIIATLQQGGTASPEKPVAGKILIAEGYTIDQIATAISDNVNTKNKNDKTPYTKDSFLKLMKDTKFISKMNKKYPKLLSNMPAADKAKYQLEGYLFPATYNYYDHSTLEDIVDDMLSTMNAKLSPYYSQIASSNRTVNDILTLASLVEKEGSTDDDRRKIASVFYNRLSIKMPLQSNIAVLYAMGKLGQKTTLKEDATIDTKINSPYNVYANAGLMPGPVDSPGLSAIKATIDPADTHNLYFVADVTSGEVHYSEDYATHESNVSKYVNKHLDSSDNNSN